VVSRGEFVVLVPALAQQAAQMKRLRPCRSTTRRPPELDRQRRLHFEQVKFSKKRGVVAITDLAIAAAALR